MKAKDVSAILVTRGDCDLTPIINTLPYSDVIVYDNSKRHDFGIYGRYFAIREAKNPVVYVQDDDLLVTCHDQLLDAYQPGVLTVNYPEPWDIPWVARGGIFDCDLPGYAFGRYLAHYPFDRYFSHFACDGIFALLTEQVTVIDEGSVDLPHGFHPGRVSTSPGWYDHHRPLIQARCAELQAVTA